MCVCVCVCVSGGGGVTSICTAVTAATIHLDSEEVELLCILPYIVGSKGKMCV